jgi:hypothetical protein
MSIHSNHEVPASSEDRERQNREMKERMAAHLRDAEGRRRWVETYAAMGLDDIIEIPCIGDGKKVMRRFHERGGKLIRSRSDVG